MSELISIIVPIYNGEKCLHTSIESVLAQTVENWELLLIDDGSTDGTSALCDAWAARDNRIRAFHKSNGGVSSARNLGLDKAGGSLVTFCDSDDYLEPDYLELLLRTAQENPDCGHVWCCFQTVTGCHKENAVPNYVAAEPLLRCTRQAYMSLHELWLDTSLWNKLFRMEVIRRAQLRFPEDLSLGEDWLFNLAYIDASENEAFVVVTKPLYNYVRGNEESLDSKYRSDLLDIYRRLNAACQSCLQRWGVSPEQWDKFYNSRFYMYEKVLRNTMRAPDMSRREKLAWNNAFMRSGEFLDALRTRRCFVHPLYLAAYRSGRYARILQLDWLYRLKNTRMKKA